MKNKLLPLFVVLGTYSAYSQVGVGTMTPKPSAQLEVSSNDKGILIPRVALKSTTDVSTVTHGSNGLPYENSLLVFNTATIADIIPGYYYWYVDRWYKLAISGENGTGPATAAGDGPPGKKGETGYPGEGIVVYIDNLTGDVYVQNPDGTWTKINGATGPKGPQGEPGKDGKVGTAAGDGAPGIAGTTGAPGKDINIYTDTVSKTVYVQNPDGTWTPINGPKGDQGEKGEMGYAGGTGLPGDLIIKDFF